MKPTLDVKDFTKSFQETIRKFKRDKVLVGIPQDDNTRQDDQPIGNAALLAINHFGSPKQGIPARPVLEIGIRLAQKDIAEQFKGAAQKALSGNVSAVHAMYERAGIVAANAVKKAINDQIGIDPPSDATLRARESRGFEGDKALIVTGQMRNAITHVVREG